jgi:succinate dehydrogenase / fumarate reductase cytochrome b subunit
MPPKKKRPVYLNLFAIRLPVGGVVSIIHRITGVLLVLFLPVGIYLFQQSMNSAHGFHKILSLLDSTAGRFALLCLVWFFAQHFFSGVRHLFFDIDVGVGKGAARATAWLTWVGSAVAVIGAYLCL